MHLYLDIKTIPSQRPGNREEIAATITPPGNISKAETIAAWEADKKPALVDEAYMKTQFDGAAGHVVSIACAVDDDHARALNVVRCERPGQALSEDDDLGNAGEDLDYDQFLDLERGRLVAAFAIMTDHLQAAANAAEKHRHGPGRGFVYVRGGEIRDCQANIGPVTVVGHYADHILRFLFQRAVILGVPVRRWFPVNARANSSTGGFMGPAVFDTMTYWTGYGGRISLDRLCEALGIKDRDTIAGDDVFDAWLVGNGDDIWRVNAGDVNRVRDVHRKLTFWHPPVEVADSDIGAMEAGRD